MLQAVNGDDSKKNIESILKTYKDNAKSPLIVTSHTGKQLREKGVSSELYKVSKYLN